MNDNDFMRQQQAAVERMREMNSRSVYGGNRSHKMPPVPSFVSVPQNNNNQNRNNRQRSTQSNIPDNQNQKREQAAPQPPPVKQPPPKQNNNGLFPSGTSIPFLDKLMNDGDTALIIGLLLILMSENADKKLLFALVYILL